MATAHNIKPQDSWNEDLSPQVAQWIGGNLLLGFGVGQNLFPSLENGSANVPLVSLASQSMEPKVKIDDDFHNWLLDQASVLRQQRPAWLDWDNLAEELEAMAIAERRELSRRLTTLFEHLLKLVYQPNELPVRGHGWRLTVARTRIEIRRLLDESPGLKGQVENLLPRAYSDARESAGTAMGWRRRQWDETFPDVSPWRLEQALETDFFPAPIE